MSVQAWYTRCVGIQASKGGFDAPGWSNWSTYPQSMTRILFGLLLVSMALIQATVLPRVNPFSVYPDLVLVLLFVWSSTRSLRESLFWIFFTGILLDVLALDFFGTNALSLAIVVFLGGLARQRVLLANVLIPIALIVIATVFHGVTLAWLRGGSPEGWFIPIQALIHALAIPFIYLAMRGIDR